MAWLYVYFNSLWVYYVSLSPRKSFLPPEWKTSLSLENQSLLATPGITLGSSCQNKQLWFRQFGIPGVPPVQCRQCVSVWAMRQNDITCLPFCSSSRPIGKMIRSRWAPHIFIWCAAVFSEQEIVALVSMLMNGPEVDSEGTAEYARWQVPSVQVQYQLRRK